MKGTVLHLTGASRLWGTKHFFLRQHLAFFLDILIIDLLPEGCSEIIEQHVKLIKFSGQLRQM